MLASCGVDPDETQAVHELSGGTFNAVYRIRRRDGGGLVLKVSPRQGATVMSYEHDVMHAETTYYRAAESVGWVPVPRVVHADFGRTVVDSDLLLMSDLPGQGWHDQHDAIGEERARLRGDLGRMVAALHQVTGTAFGYPRGRETRLAPSWSAAFTAMFDAVCDDATRFAVELLPVPVAELSALVRAHQDLLDEVTTPVLVHFDLWDGNILVDRVDGRATVTGLIDGERAFWGDPVAEFVSLALLRDIEQDAAFLAGYRETAQVVFDDRTRRRLSLYRCYLYLIMLVESAPRRYSDAQLRWLRDVVVPCLTTELEAARG